MAISFPKGVDQTRQKGGAHRKRKNTCSIPRVVFTAQRVRAQTQTLRVPQRRSPGVLLAGQRSIW